MSAGASGGLTCAIAGYDGSVGIAILAACGTAILLTAGPLRTRVRRPVVDLLVAIEGAGLAVGGLLLLEDVGTASWVVGPLALAIMAPLHVRALFAGEGPFRT